MKSIESDTIDLIYCDILYGTGRKFSDYQDLKPIRTEMKRILKPTGSIYLQMDTKINHWIRNIMDDIFGYNNFRNQIIWKRTSGVNTTQNYFYDVTDYILIYSVSNTRTFNEQYVDNINSTIDRYNKLDENVDKYMLCNIQSKKNFKFENDIRTLNNIQFKNKHGLGWDWTQETLDERIKDVYIFETYSGTIQYRRYLHDSKGKRVNTLWNDFSNITSTVDKYDTQKPIALLERIIKAPSNENDLVADFYMGSGTTTVACQNLNRNFIGCDINPKAIEITEKRLNKGINKFIN